MKNVTEKLDRFKYPLLVLIVGVMLMLIPGGDKTEYPSGTEDEILAAILSETKGIGETRLLISENGVVVVSQGADKAGVRLDIIQAVSSYTGFASDKITILKMAD